MSNELDRDTTATYSIALDERHDFENHLRSYGQTIRWATAGTIWRVQGPLHLLRRVTDFLNTLRG